MLADQAAGLLLAVILLWVLTYLVIVDGETVLRGGHENSREKVPMQIGNAISMQQLTLKKFQNRLFEILDTVQDCRQRLPEHQQSIAARIEELLTTVELFFQRLARTMPQHHQPRIPNTAIQKVIIQVEMLYPVIDQLASCIAGLSGAASEDVATVIHHSRRVKRDLHI